MLAKLKAEMKEKQARLKIIRESNSPTTASTTPNLTLIPVGSLTTPGEVVDLNKILEEVDIVQSTPLPTSPPNTSSPQQKPRPPTNISLQICQQPSATISVPSKELVTYSKQVQTQDFLAFPKKGKWPNCT